MTPALTALAADLHAAAHLTGTFTLRSGATASEYFDKYRMESDPALLDRVATAMAPLVPARTQALAGLELGGVPLAVALSRLTGVPARFVRKEAKTYGTANLAEGGDVDGVALTVVEDVVTSGGQVLASVADLRARGAVVDTVVCVVDREAGGRQAMAADDLELRPLLTLADLTAAATA